MIFGDRFFTHVASEAGVTAEMLDARGNIAWRMKTPLLHQAYKELEGLPDGMPPFCRGGGVDLGQQPILRMHPVIGRTDEETAGITYVRQGRRGRFWIEPSILPATMANALDTFRGEPVTRIVGHPALEGCTITNLCRMGEIVMLGFIEP